MQTLRLTKKIPRSRGEKFASSSGRNDLFAEAEQSRLWKGFAGTEHSKSNCENVCRGEELLRIRFGRTEVSVYKFILFGLIEYTLDN